MSATTKVIRDELEKIAGENGGLLLPRSVVEAARSPQSPLHSKFDWDDTVAAEQHRLLQARQLIAITVNIVGGGTVNERLWVSLKPDRSSGGGYRGLVTVMSDTNLRAQLLEDALDDMEIFQTKYRHLKELADVFASMRRVKKPRKVA